MGWIIFATLVLVIGGGWVLRRAAIRRKRAREISDTTYPLW